MFRRDQLRRLSELLRPGSLRLLLDIRSGSRGEMLLWPYMTPTILLIVGGGLTIAIVVLLVLYNIERGRVLRSKEALRTKEADLLRIGKEQSDQRTDYEARLGEARKGHEDLVNKYSGFIDQDLAIAERTAKLEALDTRLLDLNKEQTLLQGHVNELGKTIELYEETLELQESGLYKPQFGFDISERYKNALELNYLAQRNMLKDDAAVICRTAWEVGGSKAEGKKMTTRYKKLMLYAFNGECDGLIAKVKWNNVVKVRERIIKAFETINKLGESHSIAIQDPFLSLRLEELALSFEYEEKRQQETEEQRRITIKGNRSSIRDDELFFDFTNSRLLVIEPVHDCNYLISL